MNKQEIRNVFSRIRALTIPLTTIGELRPKISSIERTIIDFKWIEIYCFNEEVITLTDNFNKQIWVSST